MTEAFAHLRRLRALSENRLRPFWLETDCDYRVLRWGGADAYYGYDKMAVGEDCRTVMPFLYGIGDGPVTPDSAAMSDDRVEPGSEDSKHLLTFVETASEVAAHVRVERSATGWSIYLLDANEERNHRQEAQQIANEVQILNYRNEQLVAQLRAARDEIDLKRREAEEASRLKSRFIAGMSHEFRTPLTSILGYAQRLRGYGDSVSSEVGIIERAAHHLLTLVDNLLGQGSADAGALTIRVLPVRLGEIFSDMEGIFRSLATAKSLDLQVRTDSSLPQVVEVDETRLRQILVNLLGNGIKFTPAGGVQLRASWASGMLCCEVTDTGPGIEPQLQARIFTPFGRLDNPGTPGTGLGLAISRQLATLMGGTLVLRSVPARGSTFVLSLPAPSCEMSAPGVSVEGNLGPARQAGGATVLLIEDDADIRELVRIFLQDAGYRLVCAGDGESGVRLTEQTRPNVVLTDLNLPGLDGCEVALRLRSSGYLGPLLALSASPLESDRLRALGAGCDDYVLKPLDMERLTQMVSDLVQTAQDTQPEFQST